MGPDAAQKLNDGGVFHFWQIAAMTAGRCRQGRRTTSSSVAASRARRLGCPGSRTRRRGIRDGGVIGARNALDLTLISADDSETRASALSTRAVRPSPVRSAAGLSGTPPHRRQQGLETDGERSPPRMVKELRDKTGAGMMDCKTALSEAGGDIEAAHRLAAQEGPVEGRQEGPAASPPKASSPSPSQGTEGVVVEVNSETDFVARNPEFQALATIDRRCRAGARRRRRGAARPALSRRRHRCRRRSPTPSPPSART